MAIITSAATGLWSATATWVGGVVPVLGDKLTIANGHTVTVDGTYSVGDDTTTALTINGVLKASRTASSDLTVRGGVTSTQLVTSGSAAGLDYGTEADPIPVAYTAVLRLNDSAALANGKYSLNFPRGQFFKAWGAEKKPWTRLTAGVAAAAGSISVTDATGWAVNDWIYVASTIDGSPSSVDYVQVSSISGSGPYTVGVTPALSFAHAISAPVANMTRNVVIRPASIAHGAAVLLSYGSETAANINLYMAARYELGNVELYCLGSTVLGGNTGFDAVTINGFDARSITVTPIRKLYGIAGHNPKTGTVTSGNCGVMPFNLGTVNPVSMDWCVGASRNGSQLSLLYGLRVTVTNFCGPYSGGFGLQLSGTQGPVSSTISQSYFGGALQAGLFANVGINNAITDCDFGPSAAFMIPAFGGPLVLDNCRIGVGAGNAKSTNFLSFGLISPGAVGDFTIKNSEVQTYTRAQAHFQDAQTSDSTLVKVYNSNGDANDYYQMRYASDTYADTSMVYRSTRSIKVMPYTASKACVNTIPVAGVAGVPVTVVGYIRLNATYGATPITAVLSGLGSTPVTFTGSTTADVWQQFTLTVTPTSTGNLTLTVTGASANTTTAAYWIDGVFNDPFTPWARHYGFTYDPSNPARTVDAVVQLSEAAAAALTGISYASGTLTISGTRSIREVYDWLKQYEASNRLAPIITSADGVNFTLAANLTLSGSITGAGQLAVTGTFTGTAPSTVLITHPAGAYVPISVTGYVAGSRVQIVNVSTATELYNAEPAGGTVTINAAWTTNQTLRVRVGYAVGTAAKLPIETVGLLTASGASFLIAQQDDTIYNALAIDGGACAEFAPDYPNLQIDLSDGDGGTTAQRLYAWAAWSQTSELGIAAMFRAVSADDALNFTINVGVVDARLDNVLSSPIVISGGYLRRSDGSSVIAATSGSIQMDPGRAYQAPSGVNVRYVNGTAIGGSGTAGNPWGPA